MDWKQHDFTARNKQGKRHYSTWTQVEEKPCIIAVKYHALSLQENHINVPTVVYWHIEVVGSTLETLLKNNIELDIHKLHNVTCSDMCKSHACINLDITLISHNNVDLSLEIVSTLMINRYWEVYLKLHNPNIEPTQTLESDDIGRWISHSLRLPSWN